MCQWCAAILNREKRYTAQVLDLSINLFLRLLLDDHFELEKLAWFNSILSKEDYAFHLARHLPANFVNSRVWSLLQYKYPSVIREAIRSAYQAKKKRRKISMDLIHLRVSKYLSWSGPAATPNKLNHYQAKI